MPSEPAEPYFTGARTRRLSEKFDDVSFVMVEAEGRVRQHRRIVAVSQNDRALNGKSVVYADTFPERRDATYIYARHRWDAETFLRELGTFLLSEFPEWAGRSFPTVLNVDGERLSLDSHIPFRNDLPNPSSIRFAKFTLPFGPITIEFGKPRTIENDLRSLESGRLLRALETPLIGCDVTKTELATELIARGHWSSSKIPMDVLSALLLQAAPTLA